MVTFLVSLVVMALVIWIVSEVLKSLEMPNNLRLAVLGIFALLFILWLFGGGGAFQLPRSPLVR